MISLIKEKYNKMKFSINELRAFNIEIKTIEKENLFACKKIIDLCAEIGEPSPNDFDLAKNKLTDWTTKSTSLVNELLMLDQEMLNLATKFCINHQWLLSIVMKRISSIRSITNYTLQLVDATSRKIGVDMIDLLTKNPLKNITPKPPFSWDPRKAN